jgi:hypothetical protein
MAVASSASKTVWRIVAEEVDSCNCAWGCPCQFNALPTNGFCEVLVALDIQSGHFGATPLDGAKFAEIMHWEGPVHEGNG